jgi:hypothetical protein
METPFRSVPVAFSPPEKELSWKKAFLGGFFLDDALEGVKNRG